MKPEIQHIAISQPDGSLAIMQFVTKGHLDAVGTIFERDATDEAVAEEIAKAGLSPVSWRRIDAVDIPADRQFRAAWRDNGQIDIDMPTARDIHRDRLREMRAPRLRVLDIEYQRADEAGDDARKAEIAVLKQALRDVTTDPAIDMAETPDILVDAIPAALVEG